MAHPGFTCEFNRPIAYRDRLVQLLMKRGFDVVALPHKTLFRIRYAGAKKFRLLKRALRRVMRHRNGSVYLTSKKTGRDWIMKTGGNRAFQFVQY